jgi:hypothetical protein
MIKTNLSSTKFEDGFLHISEADLVETTQEIDK